MALKQKPATLHELGEQEWLRRVRGWFAPPRGGAGESALELGIGDDAAIVRTRGRLVATTDALIENIHFRRHTISPRDLGYKSLVVNLSDLAAMAARPVAALLTVSVPGNTPLSALREFFMGVRAASRRFGCPLAGGDMTAAPAWTINVTALGEPLGKRVPLRSAARPGDYVYITGAPGESGAALHALEKKIAPSTVPAGLLTRHRRPTPRLAEAARLARLCPRLAMLDVSDGLWNDAGQIASASGVAMDLDAAALPISRRLASYAARVGRPARDFVLFGGEDYELLFATGLSPAKLLAAFGRTLGLAPLHCIGRVRAGRGVRLLDPAGRPIRLADRTFRHY